MQRSFNLSKREVVSFGRSNKGRTDRIKGRTIRNTEEQKNLGVQIPAGGTLHKW